MKKLIKNVGIYRDHKITESQNIAIKDDLIIGFPLDPVPAAYDEVIDGNNMLAFPGFVKTHNHIAMTVFRSYAADLKDIIL